jgi:hypothetical protein
VGATTNGKNVGVFEPGLAQLILVGRPEVKQIFSGNFLNRPEQVRGMAPAGKGAPDIAPHLVTRGGNTRTQDRAQFRRPAAEFVPEDSHNLVHDPQVCSPPSTVNRSQHSPLGTGDKDRQAIGGPDHQQDTGQVRHQGISSERARRMIG